jgi:hypothetical protein
MMMARVPCPQCGAVLKSSKTLAAGTKVLCRKCGTKFQVGPEGPAPDEPVTAEQAFVFDQPGPAAVPPSPAEENGLHVFQFAGPSTAVASETRVPSDSAPAPLACTQRSSSDTPSAAAGLPQPQSIHPYVLGLVFALSVLFVLSGVALVIVCLSGPREKTSKPGVGDGTPIIRATHVPTKKLAVKQPEIDKPLTKDKVDIVAKPAADEKKSDGDDRLLTKPMDDKPPAVEKKPDEDKPVVVEKKPDPEKPATPKPDPVAHVDDSQLAGCVRLTSHLATARKPKPLTNAMKLGLKWLASKQRTDGGWGEGGLGRFPVKRFGGAADPDSSNVADTCIATLALLRSGSTPVDGSYAKHILQSVTYICKKVEDADTDTLVLIKPEGVPVNGKNGFMNRGTTLVQMKIGTHVDTFLATLLLAEVKDRMPNAEADKRVADALKKLTAKMERSQTTEGSWTPEGYNAWAPVLGQALGTKAIHRARQAGAAVSDQALERAKKFAEKSFDARTGKFTVDARAAGVALYSASGNLAALQDAVNTYKTLEKEIRQTASSGSTETLRQSAVNQLTTIDKTKKTHQKASKVVIKNLSNQRFVSGFGNNGGEEFLSYLNISEALAVQGGKDWTAWEKLMTRNLSRVQNKDGSWAGLHCITGRTFCTASALLVLMADRSPVPVALKIKD